MDFFSVTIRLKDGPYFECMSLYFKNLCAAFGPIIPAKCATPDAGVEAKCFEPFFQVFHAVCCGMSIDVVKCRPGDAT